VEPDKQIEVQLGHLCNNRCVFCVSGQMTERRAAGPMDLAGLAPQLEAIRRAHAEGHRKVTLLGGEPTLQPGFLGLVREIVALGFDEIVLFTNGARTARAAFVDEILATGGAFTFRVSIQGATKEAHERTTRKPGSFDRILATLAILAERRQRVTINMCVVTSNYASVTAFPELVARYGVRQLHLDMVRPLDAGDRTEAELRAMIPRYSDMVPALEEMARGFAALGDRAPDAPDAPEIEVNLGNLPYCVAPSLAHLIHHDGEPTLTVAVDGAREASAPWDKYAVKRRDKKKPASCAPCAFEASCSGVFETYERFYGLSELAPIAPTPAKQGASPRLVRSVAARVARLRSAAPFEGLVWREVVAQQEGTHAEVLFDGRSGERVAMWFSERDGKPTGGYRLDRGEPTPAVVAAIRAMIDALRVRLAVVKAR
jgi:MoaA/NifB/PqqE/SkfB family radical SAM enzyme